jgi:hypothetical protein
MKTPFAPYLLPIFSPTATQTAVFTNFIQAENGEVRIESLVREATQATA